MDKEGQKPIQVLRRFLTASVLTFLAFYLLALAILTFCQRDLLYLRNERVVQSATSVALTGIREFQLRTSDGQSLRAWYRPAAAGRPLVVFFHGNGGSIADFTNYYRPLIADGDGVLTVEYPGYPGSTGSPTEAGLLAAGEAAYGKALSLGVPSQRIVVMGVSLGSAVAVSVAAKHPIAALVLDSPPSSAADVAAARYWMFPTRWLIFDPYRSDLRIGHVHAPLLIVHGDQDTVIPIRFGRRLYALANQPKRFMEVPGAEHMAMGRVMPAVVAWIDASSKRPA